MFALITWTKTKKRIRSRHRRSGSEFSAFLTSSRASRHPPLKPPANSCDRNANLTAPASNSRAFPTPSASPSSIARSAASEAHRMCRSAKVSDACLVFSTSASSNVSPCAANRLPSDSNRRVMDSNRRAAASMARAILPSSSSHAHITADALAVRRSARELGSSAGHSFIAPAISRSSVCKSRSSRMASTLAPGHSGISRKMACGSVRDARTSSILSRNSRRASGSAGRASRTSSAKSRSRGPNAFRSRSSLPSADDVLVNSCDDAVSGGFLSFVSSRSSSVWRRSSKSASSLRTTDGESSSVRLSFVGFSTASSPPSF